MYQGVQCVGVYGLKEVMSKLPSLSFCLKMDYLLCVHVPRCPVCRSLWTQRGDVKIAISFFLFEDGLFTMCTCTNVSSVSV